MGVDRKRPHFDRLAADVIVVPECSRAPLFAQELGVSFAWRGMRATKGLGVFGRNGWRVAPREERTEIPWVLPLQVLDARDEKVALLLAIWTVAHRGGRSYEAQVAAAVTEWAEEIRSEAVILAGDFNCTAQSPAGSRRPTHADLLRDLGAVSAYHAHHGCDHGAEADMTLRWIGPGRVPRRYHCDFVWMSAALAPRLAGVEVGTFAEWIETGISDHCPVIVDLACPDGPARDPG
jgi:endonuclease/exonuclease/phosphatase family protein